MTPEDNAAPGPAPCLLCRGTDRDVVFSATGTMAAAESQDFVCTNASHGEHGDIVRCRGCGLVYAHPQPADDELIALYAATTDPIYAEEKKYRLVNFRHLFKHHLSPLQPAGRALDVGCHIGAFLDTAKEMGLEAWGVEPSAWAVERARAEGLNVIRGTLAEHQPSLPDRFDLVTIWDVIEHFGNPRHELELAHSRLADGGLLALTTMDVSSRFARLLGRRWPWLMRMHLFYFDPGTLGRLLEETGFEVITIEPCRRIVSLGYLLAKLGTYIPRSARLGLALARKIGIADRAVPINFGDIVIAIARRA